MGIDHPINISPQDAVQLPLHDASLVRLVIEPARDGFVTASLRVRINSEELVHPLRELGITGSDLCFVFESCWQVKTDLLGYAATPELISAFEIEEESGLKQKMLAAGVGNRSMVHFRIEGSQGSQLDILANSISVVELNAAQNQE